MAHRSETFIDRRSHAMRLAALEEYQRDITKVGKGRHHWKPHLVRLLGTSAGRNPTFADWITLNFSVRNVGTSNELYRALMYPVDPSVDAWIHNNRWIARCECGGQEVIDPADRGFFCLSCKNFITGGRTRKVDVTTNWQGLEYLMLQRADVLTRCMAYLQNPRTLAWTRLESVNDISVENAAHGLPDDYPDPPAAGSPNLKV